MKVILLNSVPKLGQRFDIKDVSDGYATNFLFPKRLAEPATEKKVKAIEERRSSEKEEQKLQAALLHEDLQKLSGKTVTLSVKANEQGHLFQGLHERDVVSAIQKEMGITLPENVIQLPEPIKETGEHTLAVVAGGKETTVELSVVREK